MHDCWNFFSTRQGNKKRVVFDPGMVANEMFCSIVDLELQVSSIGYASEESDSFVLH